MAVEQSLRPSNLGAGWHPNPANHHWLRWWDGKNWVSSYWPRSIEPREYLPGASRIDVSMAGEPRLDIVGEAYRSGEILAAIGHESTPRDVEFEAYGTAELVPEPDNPHDSHAVSIRLDGYNVGYLPAEIAGDYFKVLSRFVANGFVPTVRTRVWGVTRFVPSRGREELKCAIRIAIGSADDLIPDNAIPRGAHFVIPRGRSVQVSGEQEHFDVLSEFVRPSGARVIVTLHPIEGKSKVATIVLEVRLNEQRIGQLTPATSSALLPMVDEARASGAEAAAWASLSGSRLAAEVVLRVARAEELPDTWPSAADVFPRLSETSRTAPPAYAPQVEIGSPPEPRGLDAAVWIPGVVMLLLLTAIPFIGWLLSLVGLVGLIWWNSVRKRRSPTQRYPEMVRT